MRERLVFIWSLTVFWCLLHCDAYPQFQSQIPNGNQVPHPCQSSTWPGVGHQAMAGGGARNVFGLAFDTQGKTWNDALCRLDSDGDGTTNGEELGDPDCLWLASTGNAPSGQANSHPGVCDPIDSPQCLTINQWLNSTCPTYITAPRTVSVRPTTAQPITAQPITARSTSNDTANATTTTGALSTTTTGALSTTITASPFPIETETFPASPSIRRTVRTTSRATSRRDTSSAANPPQDSVYQTLRYASISLLVVVAVLFLLMTTIFINMWLTQETPKIDPNIDFKFNKGVI